MKNDLGDTSLEGTWIQVDAALSPGNSGVPLVNETASASVIQKYVSECKDAFSYLTRDLRKEAERLSAKLKEMKSGETYIPPNIDDEGADIVRVQSPMRKNVNEHDVLIIYEDTPYLLWIESTAGLTLGEQVMPCPVYVNGTATAATRGGSSTSVTVLQTITQDELKNVMRPPVANNTAASNSVANNSGTTSSAGASGSKASSTTGSADGYRVWNDQTGKHSIEALLLSSDTDKVRLKKRDGKVIEIPIKTLCDADVKYLKGS